MSTVIYWFSGTGNSLHAAKAIAEGSDDARLEPIARAMREPPAEPADRIGLVFPVYAWGPPRIVERFIERMPARSDAYVFAVVTYGGQPGSAAGILRGMLRRRGLELAAAFGVKMVENYPPFGGAPGEQKRQAALAKADTRIAEIARELAGSPRGRVEKAMLLWRVLGRAVYPLFCWSLKRSDRKFRADEKCNSCGLCVQVCPVGNIELADGRPRWLGRCEQCYACFHLCPQSAIQYGRKTAGQVRYHHPDCRPSDLIAADQPGAAD